MKNTLRVAACSLLLVSTLAGNAIASEEGAADKAAMTGATSGFDKVEPDGANLRKVLADSPLAKAVLPFGPKYTLVIPAQSGGGLFVERMKDEFINELPALCKTQWQWKVFKQDVMSNKVALDWEDTNFEGKPRLLLRSTAKNPTTREPVEMRGSRCKGSFDIVTLFTTGGSNLFPHSFLVRHEKKQTTIAKSETIRLPPADLTPADGILPGTLVDVSGYPAPTAVAVWGLSLCESRGGVSRFAIPAWQKMYSDASQMASIDIPTRGSGNAPSTTFFFECGGSNGFLLKGENFDSKVRLIYQAGRSLDSVL